MPVVVVFSCEICGARPDPETQGALERQLLDLRHGEYVDAGRPGRPVADLARPRHVRPGALRLR